MPLASLGEPEDSSDLRAWILKLPDSTRISFERGGKLLGTKSGARYAAYQGTRTLGAYKKIQGKDAWRDLKNDIKHGLAKFPEHVWRQRLHMGVSVLGIFSLARVGTGTAEVADRLVTLEDFESFAATEIDARLGQRGDSKIMTIENSGNWAGPDRLGEQALRLAGHSATMAKALGYEALEDGPTHPAPVGGPLVDSLIAEGISDYRVYAISSEATNKMQSVKQLSAHPKWAIEGGFRDKLRDELEHVISVKKALLLVPHHEYRADKKQYGDRCEVKHLLMPATEKLMADGTPARLKVRIVLADIRGIFQIDRTFSATVNDDSIRFYESFLLGRKGAKRRVLDIKGAYFEGKVPTPEEGGRVLYARVPLGWEEFGFPMVDSVTGEPNYFRVVGNVPGRQDAGVIWQDEYDKLLFEQDFSQSVVDRRIFYKSIVKADGRDGLFVIGVYVDDNWTHCECDVAWEAFYAKWSARFKPSLTNDLMGRDFCGVSYTDKDDGTVELSCEKLLNSLREMVAEYICMRATPDTPMSGEALGLMRRPPTAELPLLGEEYVAKARQIAGLVLYVVRSARPDVAFSSVAITQHIACNLTMAVWDAVIRVAHYLVSTPEKRLIYRPQWRHGQPEFVCNCDSSCINIATDLTSFGGAAEATPGLGPLGSSMGGFAMYHPGSGAFQWEVFTPRKLALSSAGSELTMATWAAKSIVAYRIMQRELFLPPASPTILEMDASAVLDGVKMERVTRTQRYQAVRLAALRLWVRDSVLRFRKTRSADMRADALSKPVSPAATYNRLALLLLTGEEPEQLDDVSPHG